MILDQFLNESSFGYAEDVYGTIEPLEEGYILGEDGNELSMINNEATTELNTIDENIMLIESVALVKELQGANVESLRENAVTDFFKKVKETIKKMAAKVKAFFERLFKSIMIQLRDVNKSLENVDKYLDKDFSDFKYDAHEWNSSPSIPNAISTNSKKFVDDIKSKIDKYKTAAVNKSNNAFISIQKYDTEESNATRINAIIGKTVNTIEAANDAIREDFGCKDSTKEFTGSKANFISMVSFLKSFNKNKVLVDLQNTSKKAYNDSLQAIDKMEKTVNDLNAQEAPNPKVIKDAQTQIKNLASYATGGLKVLNGLMGTCINCNKMRFKEYRSIVASAVRYNPKNK